MKGLARVVCVVAGIGAASAAAAAAEAQEADSYARVSSGTRTLALGGGTTIKLLLEAGNLGGTELEVAEITFPVGTNPPGEHRHGAVEIFYVVEGVLGHVVNGQEHRVEPGMVAVVRPGDTVAHRVLSEIPVRALVLWVPGGEAGRIAPPERWTPIGSGR